MAQAVLDAFLRVVLGDDLVLQIEILPVRNIGNRQALEIADPGIALFVHPAGQAVDHVVDDAEAVMHGRRADLHAAGAERDEFGGVAPALDAADAGNRDVAGLGIAGDLRHHVERDGLHRRAAIAAGGALAVHGGRRRHLVEIDADDGIDGVDQADRIGTAAHRRPRRAEDAGDIRRQLDDNRHAAVLLAPAGHHLDVLRHLAAPGTHAPPAHAVRAAGLTPQPARTGP